MPGAPLALLGPGTGLGVSGLIPAGEHWIPLQGEGGHVTLSVMNEREIAVLKQLHQRFTHVSAERVICGPGLVNLYDAVCALEGVVPKVLTPPEITRRAREGSCRLCLEALSMFCALLGTLAGNLVLTLGAVGGCYIGGGIVPGLGSFFTSSHFRDRFEDKGRFADYLSRVPTYVIRSKLPAFVGLRHGVHCAGTALGSRIAVAFCPFGHVRIRGRTPYRLCTGITWGVSVHENRVRVSVPGPWPLAAAGSPSHRPHRRRPPPPSGIGAAGGTVSNGGAQVVIPAGALTQATPIAIEQTECRRAAAASQAWSASDRCSPSHRTARRSLRRHSDVAV